MKTIIISLCLVFWIGTVQAQVVKLDPTTVTYPRVITSSNMENLEFHITEDYDNQFATNPLKFVKDKFDLKSFGMEFPYGVEVSFINSKGYLKANFNSKGELKRTSQYFKDIELPRAVRNKLYKDNVGWNMVSNKYIASGKAYTINKEQYKIKMVKLNGKEVRRIKIIPESTSLEGRIADKN